jgi:hypothetical protein
MSDSSTRTSLQNWTNISAGPRQVKDVAKAVSALHWEGKTFVQLYGVTGGTEHRSVMTSPFGQVRPEAVALDLAIRERFGYQITKANTRDILAAYTAAVTEAETSRPVEDERRTPEADAEIQAKMAEQGAAQQAKQDASDAILAGVLAKAPRGAKALIIAEWHEDASDPMSDYSASHTTRTVAIGFRSSSRENFLALTAAAKAFPETAGTTFTEHRDNHSMGAGNYLSDHGWAGSGTGWLIRSRDIPASGKMTYLDLTGDAIPDSAPARPARSAPPRGNGVTISPSSIGRAGVVEVRFDAKPVTEVIASLKSHGFRWARGNACWYGTDTAFADSLAAGGRQ